MEYRAVDGRCAFPLTSLDAMTPGEVQIILSQKGFRLITVDVITVARRCIGFSRFKRRAAMDAAPQFVDCSSFTKWVYGQRGIWIPRLSIQQRAFAEKYGESVSLDTLVGGELIFTVGKVNYYHDDPSDGIGHVGIATGHDTVIHAMQEKSGVVEMPLKSFVKKEKFRGAYRLIPRQAEVGTFQIPVNGDRDIETSDDMKWLILESCFWIEKKRTA